MKILATIVSVTIFAANLFASDALLPQRVLYLGHRARDFEPLPEKYFAKLEFVPLDEFKPSQAKDFDVVLLDWSQSGTTRGNWLEGSPLGKREEWNKPTVLLGSAALHPLTTLRLRISHRRLCTFVGIGSRVAARRSSQSHGTCFLHRSGLATTRSRRAAVRDGGD
jgi:hypothetical protein